MIPISVSSIGKREYKYGLDCLHTGKISFGGKYIEEFEAIWVAYRGMKHGVAMANGSLALSADISCLDLGLGDIVIQPKPVRKWQFPNLHLGNIGSIGPE